jgi:hypothetical protein
MTGGERAMREEFALSVANSRNCLRQLPEVTAQFS